MRRISNKSHYHITLKSITSEQLKQASQLVRAKPTTIDLRRDKRTQQDRMLTKYQPNTDLSRVENDVQVLLDQGYAVARYKLEMMLEDLSGAKDFNLTENNYIEVHIKVKNNVSIRPKIEPFVLSSNPKEMNHFFYNGRGYSNEGVDEIIKGIEEIKNHPELELVGIHYEYTVYDSNKSNDEWWA